MIRRARCSQRWCRTATAALLLVCGLTYGALLRYYIARRGPPPFESIVDEANTRMSTIVPAESPAPRPPNQTAAKLVVDLYESAGCSGEMISVAQESSEMNCARCFDFCTKDFPGGGQVSGNAKSLRVRGGPGAVGLYGDCSGHWNYIDPHFQTFAMVADGCVKIVGTRPVSHLRFYPASTGRQPPPLWAASVAREGVHDEAVILRRLRYWESEADVSRCVACCTLFLAALLGACVAVCAFIWKSDRWCQHSAAGQHSDMLSSQLLPDCCGLRLQWSRGRTKPTADGRRRPICAVLRRLRRCVRRTTPHESKAALWSVPLVWLSRESTFHSSAVRCSASHRVLSANAVQSAFGAAFGAAFAPPKGPTLRRQWWLWSQCGRMCAPECCGSDRLQQHAHRLRVRVCARVAHEPHSRHPSAQAVVSRRRRTPTRTRTHTRTRTRSLE